MEDKKLRKICEAYINANSGIENWLHILRRVIANSDLQLRIKENNCLAIDYCIGMLRDLSEEITKQNMAFREALNTGHRSPDSAPGTYIDIDEEDWGEEDE